MGFTVRHGQRRLRPVRGEGYTDCVIEPSGEADIDRVSSKSEKRSEHLTRQLAVQNAKVVRLNRKIMGVGMEEAHRAFEYGFQLDSTSIVGLSERIESHFDKIGSNNSKIVFKVRLRDESAQSIGNIESLFSLPNAGRKEIVALTIQKDVGVGDDRSAISIYFAEPDDSREIDKTIMFSVSGPDIDWVRSIKVDLEEFISAISRPNYANILSKVRPVFMGVVTISLACAIVSTAMFASKPAVSDIDISKLKSALSIAGDSIDESLLAYAKWDAERIREPFPFWFIVPAFLGMFAMGISKDSVNKVFKSQIFYFGGMISVISQRRTMHSIFWVGIVLAAAVGVGVNYISRYIMP